MKRILILISVYILVCVTSSFAQVTANFSGTPTLVCQGQTVQFTDLSTGSPTTWTYTFPGGSPATSTLQNPVITYTALGVFNVNLIANNGGVPSSLTKPNYITVITTPVSPPPISGAINICSGQTGTYSITAVPSATNYAWTVPAGASVISGQGTTSVSINFGATSGNICVTAVNACGTSAATCLSVTVNALPSVSVNPTSTTICTGSSVTLTASGANTYSWSPPAGLSATSGSAVVANPTITTTYTVIGTSTTTGCSNTTTVNIIVNPIPTITVLPNAPSICVSGSVTLTASGASTYSWAPPTGLNTTSGAVVIASPTITTSYTVVGTAPTGCQGSKVITVSITVTPPLAPGTIVGSTLVCQGTNGNYSVSPTLNTSSYSWSVPVGSSIISGQGTNSITVNFGATSGNICVAAVNACGSSAATCLSVTINAPPSVSVNPTAATICSGTSVTLTASGANTYSWSPPSGLSSTISSTVVATPTTTTIYTVTGTSTTTGCSNTATVNMTVNPIPTITILPNAPSICVTGSVTLTASGASTYSWAPPTGLNTTTGAVVVASPTITTSYTVIGTATTGCQGSKVITVSITVTPPLAPGPIAGSTLVCQGTNVNYSVAPGLNTSSYSWTVPVGSSIVSGQGTNSITVNFGGTSGNICVAAVNACGSSAATCLSITINAPPSVSVNPTATTICSGTSLTLTASGANTYSWSPPSGLSPTSGSTVVATPTTTTIYTVTGTSTTTGCSNNATVNITVNPIPTITILPNAPSICVTGSVTLTASGASTYSWAPPTSLNTTTGAVVVASPTITTSYTVIGTATTGCQGSAAVMVTVTVAPPLTPGTIFGSATGCSGQNGNYSVAPVFNASSYSWTIPAGSSIVSGQGTNSITVNFGVTSGNICVTAVNACGSSAATCLSITIVSPPSVSASPISSSICAGSSVTLTASGASIYSWSPTSGLIPTTGSLVIASPTISTTYSVTGTATTGCSNTATVNITINPSPIITFLPNAPSICTSGSVTLTVNGATNYSWSPPTGLSSASGSMVTASPSISTTYSVTGTGTNGCQGTSFITVTVTSSPPVSPGSISGPTSVCSGQSKSYSINQVANASIYSWTVPAGCSIQSGQGTTSITINTGLTSGNVCVTASNACGNSASSCLSITVIELPSLSLSPSSTTICTGSSVTLSVNGANTYSWSPPDGLSSTSGSSATANPTANIIYTVTGTATTGCANTETATIIVMTNPPLSPASITGSINVCLIQQPENYSIASITNASTYSWTVPTGYTLTLGQGTTSITINSGSISGNICVMAGNACGMSSATCLSVTINSPPTIKASITPATCIGNISNNDGGIMITNFAGSDKCDFVSGSTYSGSSSYSTAGFIPSSGIITNTLANPTNTTAYTVRLYNNYGCTKDTTVILVSVNCLDDFFVPDAFTPDGDGINDLFVINGLPPGIENTFTVFNRWGNKVYSKTNYDNSWNGFPNGNGTMGNEKLQQGTYYYILEFKSGDVKNKNGFIVLQY